MKSSEGKGTQEEILSIPQLQMQGPGSCLFIVAAYWCFHMGVLGATLARRKKPVLSIAEENLWLFSWVPELKSLINYSALSMRNGN